MSEAMQLLESRRLLAGSGLADTINLDPADTLTLGSRTYFFGNDAVHGAELCVSDGTAAATRVVKNLTPGSRGGTVSRMTELDGRVVFFVTDRDGPVSLWISDGTNAGTTKLADFGLANQTEVEPPPLAVLDGRIVFLMHRAEGDTPFELWSSDGSVGGTSRIYTFLFPPASTYETTMHVIGTGTRALFQLEGRLWSTNGTARGTFSLTHRIPGGPGTVMEYPNALNDELLFFWQRDSTIELWKTDGTPEGSSLVKDANISGAALWNAGSALVFLGSVEGKGPDALWRTDGTEAGTAAYFDMPGPRGSALNDIYLNGKLCFFALTSHGPEFIVQLWTTDGSSTGTSLIDTIGGATPAEWTEVGDAAFFVVNQTNNHGRTIRRELWHADGTAAGTALVQDITAIGENEYGQLIDELGDANEPIPPQYFNRDFRAVSIRDVNGQLYAEGPSGAVLIDPKDAAGDTGPASATVEFADGVLRIIGSREDDNLRLSRSPSDDSILAIDLNNGRRTIALNKVQRIEIHGNAGDDGVAINEQRGEIPAAVHVFAGAGDDTVYTGSADDSIVGGAGNDSVNSGSGDDHVEGGDGDDSILSGDGNDTVTGQLGADTIKTGDGEDQLADGRDDFKDRLDGGAGADLIFLRASHELFFGADRGEDPSGLDEVLFL